MKIIDEKGKLFGKINIIDLVVLLVIICVAGAVVYRIVGGSATGSDVAVANKDVYITVKCRMIPESAALTLQNEEGIKLVAKNAYQNAEIVSVEYEASDYIEPDADGNPVWGKHPIWKDARVTIKDSISPTNPVITVGGQEARIGYKYTVKTQKVEIQGTVDEIRFED